MIGLLTSLIDKLIPFYTLGVLVIIVAYNLCREQPKEMSFRNPSIKIKQKDPSSSDDWKSIFNGTWITTEAAELDPWSDFCDHNFIIRKLSKRVMLELKHKIRIENNIISLERDFNGKKHWAGKNKIGESLEGAEPLQTDVDGIPTTIRVWASESKKLLYYEYTPKEGFILRHTRCITEEGLMEVVRCCLLVDNAC
jgi:hypothetical protein